MSLENILEWYGAQRLSVLLALEVADGKVIEGKEAPFPTLPHVPLLHTVATLNKRRPGGRTAA